MIQIDIDLPETCGDCPMKEIYHKAYYCGLIDDFIRGYKRYQERDKRCPLREQKMGHWIHTDECDEEWQYRCSKCNMSSRSNSHRYCSNCGSYMFGDEPQERSENKE